MTQRIQKGKTLELTLSAWANGGKAIAKLPTGEGDKVVFVPNGIPGQKVRVLVQKNKKSFAETRLLEVLEASPDEVKQPYQASPGAPYLHLPLALQQKYKQEAALDLFTRFGKIAHPEKKFDTFIASPQSWHYRNKMEYSFSAVAALPEEERYVDRFVLGFKKRGQWLAVEPLEKDSGLFDAQWENALPQVAAFFTEREHSAWHSRLNEGFCRILAVRKTFHDQKLLINLVTSSSELQHFDAAAFTALLQQILGERLGGVLHTINDDRSDRPKAHEGEQRLLYGQSSLEELILGLRFKISPQSFFQTNPRAAERLYAQALAYATEEMEHSRPLILDLFSGTGTLTQLLAQKAGDGQKVIGVEIVPEAVQDALANAAINGLAEQVSFFTGDVGAFLLEHPEYAEQIETVVLDPPRAGISPKTLRKIMRLSAQRIVYISCNPATQARDMAVMAEWGYRLEKFSLVDQFPHTAHLESVALFIRETYAVPA